MTDSWLTVSGWLGHTALVGAAVLLLGWVGVRLVKGPARRQRLAVWAVRAAVLAPALCLLPAWLTVPAPAFVSDELRAVSDEPEPPAEEPSVQPLSTPPDGRELAFAELAPGWDAELTLDPVAVPDLPPNADWQPPVVAERAPEPKPVAPEPPPATTSPSAPAPTAPPPTADHSPLAGVVPLVVLAYGFVAAALLGQMLLGHVGLMRLVRSARPATFRVQALFDELAAGFRRRPRVLVSDRVATPVCFGLWRPTVLLPEALARAGAEAQLRWVFAHELDHVRRGDLATGWWVGLARAMYFFVPWYWPLRRELNLAQEYLADAAAAAADGRAVDYAAFLVDLSGGPARVPRMAHAVRAGGSDLFRRVTMLLKSGAGVDRRCPRGWAALAASGVLSAAVLLSGLGIASAQDEKPKPDKKAEVEKARQKAKAKAEKARQEAERNRERAERDRERDAGQDVAAIKKAIAEAAREGDVAEIHRLAERLERAMAGQRGADRRPDRPRDGEKPRDPNRLRDPELPKVPQVPRVPKPPLPPNVPGFPGANQFRFDAPNAEQMQKAMEQAERAMREAMERLKDSPEAREQMERALQTYREAMEQGKKRVAEAQERFRDLRKANPEVPFPPGFEPFQDFGKEFERGFDFGRRPGSPRFGVMVSPVTEALAEQLDLPNDRGVVVVQVIPGSAAEKAGVKKNDVVLSFAGQEIGGDVSRFAGAVEKAKAGQKVEVVVLRKGKKETLKGIELPKAPQRDRKPGAAFQFKGPGKGEFKFPEGGRFKVPAPGKGFEKMSVQINDDEFTINASKGDTRYQLRGTVEGGKPTPSRIMIGEESYKSLEDVPEEHRATVKQLLGSIGGAR